MAILDTAKSMARGGVGFFLVGLALTLAAQVLSPMIGIDIAPLALSGTGPNNPLWTGAYFGGFGALSAAVTPLVDYLFGDKKQASPEKSQDTQKSAERSPSLALAQEQTVAVTHCERVEASRSLAAQAEVVR